MQRVVTVNLNGAAYQLEEPAYDALRAYLERAEAALAANPDRAEIVRDLEQAIADKCAASLGGHKNVVGAAEMTRILEQMGPVGAPDEEAGEEARAEPSGMGPAKRLYRVRDQHSVTGVSAGLGAYFDLDPNILRVLWILGAFLTGGFLIIVYLVLMFVMPLASTPEEVAAAHGAPFNAQEVIERAKREYAEFTAPDGTAARWRREARNAWRRAMHDRSRNWANAWSAPPVATPPVGPVSYLGRVLAGLMLVVFSLAGAALTVAFIIAIISLVTTGAVLGIDPPAGIPFWLAIVVLAIVFAAVSAPVTALRDASHAAVTGQPQYAHHAGGGGAVTLLLIAIAAWFAYSNIPEAREWMNFVGEHMRNWFQAWRLDWS